MLLFTTMSLLFVSFILHVLWWRINMPHRSTIALLICFFGVLILAILYLCLFPSTFDYSLIDISKMILLYTSCTFVYIIVYSAVEDQSPTLAIAYYLKKQSHAGGCDDNSLNNFLKADAAIRRRIFSMEKSGFIQKNHDHWFLTKKGKFFASIFDYSAKIFGLRGIGG